LNFKSLSRAYFSYVYKTKNVVQLKEAKGSLFIKGT